MTKRIVVVMMTVVLCAAAAPAEDAYEVEWTAQVGTSGSEGSRSVTVDAAGSVYISGYTDGSLGGPFVGAADAFLTKLDAGGNVLWSRHMGTGHNDDSFSVAVDTAGNAYIAGSTQGDLCGINPALGVYDAFLSKFDTSGNMLWSRQIGTLSDDWGTSVAADASGNAYITGHTRGSLGGPNAGPGKADVFLTKFDAAGNELWSQQIGTSSDDWSHSVAVDAAANAYISGFTSGSLGGANAGGADAFLAKFDSSGNELWSRQVGTATEDESYAVAVDAVGNAYISGHTDGSLGGPSAGYDDAFLIKFDASGNELWSRQIGAPWNDLSRSVAVDAAGNAYISGHTDGSLGGPSAGNDDAFLIKFDASGNELWSQQIGTASEDRSDAVAVDAAGNAYISGITHGSLGGASAGYWDAFLVKYQVPEPATLSLLTMGAVAMLRRRKS